MNEDEKDTMSVTGQAGAEEVETTAPEVGGEQAPEVPEATGEGDEAPVAPVVKDPEAEQAGGADGMGGEEMGGSDDEEGADSDTVEPTEEKDDEAVTE